jgi:hypothetical protein
MRGITSTLKRVVGKVAKLVVIGELFPRLDISESE